MERFIPRKRVAIDGRVWWCVWDCVQKCWSSYTCFGKYKTKNECQISIDVYKESWNLL